jgi:hypothetical protein
MEIVIIFCVGWVMSHAFGEKRDEYEHAQDAHREKYMRKLADKHPNWSKTRQARYLQNAARRNALGHIAYLFRHGWSSTFNDIVHGWNNAKAAHEEWKAERPKDGKEPSPWQTFKAGWKDKSRRREEAAVEREKQASRVPDSVPTPKPKLAKRCKWCGNEIASGQDNEVVLQGLPLAVCPACYKRHNLDKQHASDKQTADPQPTGEEAGDAKVYSWPSNNQTSGNTAGPTNGAPVTTTITAGEAGSIEDVRQNSAGFVQTLQQVHAAADQLLADALRFASKDRESLAILENGIEQLNNVIATFGRMPASLGKHIDGEEYAQRAHSVDDINALRTS